MSEQTITERNAPAAIDRTRTVRNGGSIGLVLLIAIVLLGAAAALLLLGRANAEPYILPLLAALAMVGVFLLFALAAGLLQFSGSEVVSPLVKAVVDGAPNPVKEGIEREEAESLLKEIEEAGGTAEIK